MNYMLEVVTHDEHLVFYGGAMLDVDLNDFVVLNGRYKVIKEFDVDEVLVVRVFNFIDKKYREYECLDLIGGFYPDLVEIYKHRTYVKEVDICS